MLTTEDVIPLEQEAGLPPGGALHGEDDGAPTLQAQETGADSVPLRVPPSATSNCSSE